MTVRLYDKISEREYEVRFNLEGKPIIVGRAGDVELNLGSSGHYSFIEPLCAKEALEDRVSRKHFSLEDCKGHVYLKDLNSTNGTMVNGEPVNDSRVPLINGDEITAGKHYGFRFHFDGNIEYAEPEKVQRNEFDELKDLGKNVLNSGYNAIMYFIDLKFLI